MCPTLERADSPEHERSQQIVSRHPVLFQCDDAGRNLIDLRERVLGIMLQVLLLLRRADYESRQIDFVDVGGVLDIEKGLEPFLSGLKTLDPWKGRTSARYDGGGAALGHGLRGVGIVHVGKNLGPEHEILDSQVKGRPEAKIALKLTAGDKSSKGKNGIGRKVVRLEAKMVKELSDEIANRELEAAFEMRNEDNKLIGLGCRHDLVAGNLALHLLRDPPGATESVDVRRGYVGAIPSGTL